MPQSPQRRRGVRTNQYSRPDASMTLLFTIMNNSLDEGYAQATARRSVRGDTGLRRGLGHRLLAALGVTLIAATITLSAVKVHADAPQAEKERQQLVDRVHRGEASADQLQREVATLHDEVDALQDRALPGGTSKQQRNQALLTGADPVRGQGLKVVADDAPDHSASGGTDPRDSEVAADGHVLDRDLQRLVNGLWQAGAEAVAVNGQRLTALSAIRAAGASILVDNRPLAPPYTVLAVGDAKRMLVDFQDSEDGRYLHALTERYRIRVTVATQKNVTLPAALTVNLRVASPQPTPPAAAGAHHGPPVFTSPGLAPTAAASTRGQPSNQPVP